MKKIIFLTILTFVLCGCTANYKLTIHDGKIKEKLTILETNKELFDVENDSGWTMRESFEALLAKDEFSKEEYNVKSLNNSEQLGIEFSTDSISSVINSSILNQCYRNPIVTVKDDIVTINTGTDFECYDLYENLENIRVVFETNHKVISTNADIKEGNSYIWNITQEGNKLIEISYDNSVTSINFVPYIISGAILLLILFVLYYIFKKNKKNNEI